MKCDLLRKQSLLAWHRWLGIGSAAFLAVVSLTGLVLNHTEFLKLDQIQVRNSFILSRYGMSGAGEISSYRIQASDTLSHLDGRLYYNRTPLGLGDKPLAIIEGDPITAVATSTRLVFLTSEGELIESLSTPRLPYQSLTTVGKAPDGTPVFVAPNGNWSPDADWIHFASYEGSYSVEPMTTIRLSEEDAEALLALFQGDGISLYRVLLDLHSGRLLGWGGRTLMDLSAIAILILISSGIGGWLRKARHNPPSRPL